MKTVKTTTKYGGSAANDKNGVARDGFRLAAVAVVSDEQADSLQSLGLASLLYRAGANVCTKALKIKLPSEAEFTDARASALILALGEWAEGADSPLKGGFDLAVSVERHTHGTVADSKFTEEREIMSRHESANDLEDWLEKTVKFDGESHGSDGEFSSDALRAVRTYKIEEVRKRMKSI